MSSEDPSPSITQDRSFAEEMKKFTAEASEASDRKVQSLFDRVADRVEKNSCDIAKIKKTIEELKQNSPDLALINMNLLL